jgi:hypothetical protein
MPRNEPLAAQNMPPPPPPKAHRNAPKPGGTNGHPAVNPLPAARAGAARPTPAAPGPRKPKASPWRTAPVGLALTARKCGPT